MFVQRPKLINYIYNVSVYVYVYIYIYIYTEREIFLQIEMFEVFNYSVFLSLSLSLDLQRSTQKSNFMQGEGQQCHLNLATKDKESRDKWPGKHRPVDWSAGT